jgi:predicted kinase
MQQRLFIMLGYPGSGKSYFAKRLAPEIKAVRLNGDSIRHNMFTDEKQRWYPRNNPLVFGALDYAAQEILKAGYSVIYDASHNRRVDRTKAAKLGEPFGVTPIIIWIQTTKETAKKRRETRDQALDQPDVPAKRFEELVANLAPPEPNEKCIVIDGLGSFQDQLDSFSKQLGGL